MWTRCGQEGNGAQLGHRKVGSSPAGGEPGQQIRILLSRTCSTGVSRTHLRGWSLNLFNTSLEFVPVKVMYKCTKSICLAVSTCRTDVMNRQVFNFTSTWMKKRIEWWKGRVVFNLISSFLSWHRGKKERNWMISVIHLQKVSSRR